MRDTLEAALLDSARSLCSHACWAIALQVRRLRSEEPEDAIFVLRWWADLQFLIVMLRRLRRSASIAASVPAIAEALADFDRSLPGLAQMRNVGEHIDAYATNDPRRHHQHIDSSGLQVGSWEYPNYSWLGQSLNVDEAVKAADKLFIAVKSAAIQSATI